MVEYTPTPWMTQPCGTLLPDDVMIVADMGKLPNGIQQISTVARILSVRQTKETTAANAAFIVKAVNNHDVLVEALTRAREAVNAIVLSTHSISFDADLRVIDLALEGVARAAGETSSEPDTAR